MASLANEAGRQGYNPNELSPLPMHRTYTNDSAHSRSALTTPHMDSAATFPEAQPQTIRPVHQQDYGNSAIHHETQQNANYPPTNGGGYHSVPNVPGIDISRVNTEHREKFGLTDEPKHKKGLMWGGANRWSASGNKEPVPLQSDSTPSTVNGRARSGSRPSSIFRGNWNTSSGAGTPRTEWEGFDFNPSQAKVEELRYAKGDLGRGKIANAYLYLLNKSIVSRWFLYIFPVLVLLWIPGIIWCAGVRDARIWGVNLLCWSIWLTVVWLGWWIALAAGMMFPHFLNYTLVAIIPSMSKMVDVFGRLTRNVAFVLWSIAIWASFTPIIINNFVGDQGTPSRSTLTLIANLAFGLFLSSLVIGGEKLLIQLIAYQFHLDSYDDRIKEQKLQIRSLVTLYINSTDVPGRRDTLTDREMGAGTHNKGVKALKTALKGFKNAAQTTTSVIGNVATEMTGQSVLQTNSPYNRVTVALSSANKSKALARRLFYSFRKDGADKVYPKDIAGFFPDQDSAQIAFAVFDRDENGSATRDEFDMAIVQMHREKVALEASMRDTDGAVRRLDSIFLVVVLFVVVLIMSSMVTDKLTTLVTSASAFVLGLSWLIGTTMQEILGAILFLFVKHPFDVGDRVDFDGNSYVVASMQLLSTTFRRMDGSYTFIGNDILRSKLIHNIRRSGSIAEVFTFEVDFGTDFKKLVELRDKMLDFLHENRRDFLHVFDVVVDSFPEQGKLVLKAEIKYKTNWQEVALKIQRRNKWICALKNALADCEIYGPGGAGNPDPGEDAPTKYTLVPYEPPAPPPAEPSAAAAETTPTRGSSGGGPNPESPPPDFLSATRGANAGAALLDPREVINDATGDVLEERGQVSGYRKSS